jgi:hypothetical protein
MALERGIYKTELAFNCSGNLGRNQFRSWLWVPGYSRRFELPSAPGIGDYFGQLSALRIKLCVRVITLIV